MAAKLKKRALAEFQQQTQVIQADTEDEEVSKKKKKLKLVLRSRNVRNSSVSSSSDHPQLDHSFPIEKCGNNSREILTLIVNTLSKLGQTGSNDEVQFIFNKLSDFVVNSSRNNLPPFVRAQIYVCLGTMLINSESLTNNYSALKVRSEEWTEVLRTERSHKVVAAVLALLANCYEKAPKLISEAVYDLAKSQLTSSDHSVKVKALNLLGTCPLDHREVFSLCSRYAHSQDPRIRTAAYETLLRVHRDHKKLLQVGMYKPICKALTDDYDGVRRVGLRLIHALSATYPDHCPDNENEEVRLADDGFAKICNAINDVCVHVRELAASLIGSMTGVSPNFLEQTLDKKLMSNMRHKKSAHEREAKMVSTGEWSSGRNWGDDGGPKQELDADMINLMSFGACGAFIHGLEDEYMSVRSTAVDSLTKLSIKNPKLAVLALDFLVDMFNDEIEQVRIKAIESLTQIAAHISLEVHQLETILSALDDYSIVVREKLHMMLQASRISTKDGLQKVITKLLENLKKYPQDKRSILMTFKKLGARHSELTLPLVTQLLEIHPFFDTAEPDIEDPSYLCILVLVFNAAQHCPTLDPLLDQHTRRHYHYLIDTYPNLIPERPPVNNNNKEITVSKKTQSWKFLTQVLDRVKEKLSNRSTSRQDQIKTLGLSTSDLRRLASIEPGMASSAEFARLYVKAQSLFLKCLSSRFWINNSSSASESLGTVRNYISQMFKICLLLKHRFHNINQATKRQVQYLKLYTMALHLVFLVNASNKSALNPTELFLIETEKLAREEDDENSPQNEFLANLLIKLDEEKDHKPGVVARILQPLLLEHLIQPLKVDEDFAKVAMSTAVIYEPQGMNEVPLKYTAGMVLAVPVDCEIINVVDTSNIRLAIKTPDQEVLLVTPRPSEFFKKDETCYRLLTNALMSHQVWSEALHVEISVVLDLSAAAAATSSSPPHSVASGTASPATTTAVATTPSGNKRKHSALDDEKNIIHLCDPVKVYVLPKPVKRGI